MPTAVVNNFDIYGCVLPVIEQAVRGMVSCINHAIEPHGDDVGDKKLELASANKDESVDTSYNFALVKNRVLTVLLNLAKKTTSPLPMRVYMAVNEEIKTLLLHAVARQLGEVIDGDAPKPELGQGSDQETDAIRIRKVKNQALQDIRTLLLWRAEWEYESVVNRQLLADSVELDRDDLSLWFIAFYRCLVGETIELRVVGALIGRDRILSMANSYEDKVFLGYAAQCVRQHIEKRLWAIINEPQPSGRSLFCDSRAMEIRNKYNLNEAQFGRLEHLESMLTQELSVISEDMRPKDINSYLADNVADIADCVMYVINKRGEKKRLRKRGTDLLVSVILGGVGGALLFWGAWRGLLPSVFGNVSSAIYVACGLVGMLVFLNALLPIIFFDSGRMAQAIGCEQKELNSIYMQDIAAHLACSIIVAPAFCLTFFSLYAAYPLGHDFSSPEMRYAAITMCVMAVLCYFFAMLYSPSKSQDYSHNRSPQQPNGELLASEIVICGGVSCQLVL